MKNEEQIGCVVMAAGMAQRFGCNKLSADLEGKSLIRRALEAVPAEILSAVVVVSQHQEILLLAREFGFTPVENRHPDLGVSHTISLGLSHLPAVDGALFQVADQPLLRQETVANLVRLWQKHPEYIAALSHKGVRGNPCIFPARFFPELLELNGDHGGSIVIRHHPDALLLLEADGCELTDVDTPDALSSLKHSQ